MNQTHPHNPQIRLSHLSIKNFKGIEEVEIDFPEPQIHGDPDIMVMGSRNGLGKTSIFEACSLLFLYIFGSDRFRDMVSQINRYGISINIPDLLIRSGSDKFDISGQVTIENKTYSPKITLLRNGKFKLENEIPKSLTKMYDYNIIDYFHTMLGLQPNPLVISNFIYFHSHRKTQEGSLELGNMLDDNASAGRINQNSILRRNSNIKSTFKQEILRLLMSRGGLFESTNEQKAELVLNKLNNLVEEYANGRIEKLKALPDSTIEFLVTPSNGGESFNFDGLSSGQKEIISTLFLIWNYTDNNPGIILIDEPELHLNSQWHRPFIKNLYNLVPNNQYIIATHSEDIFDSVDADRRILLSDD